jgi:uncharacterized protein
MAALGPVRRDAVSTPLPPAFAPWFQARCPDIRLEGARAVLELAADGATVPFIARYRRERTFNLDEVQIRRTIEAKGLFDRITSRQAIIVESIERHATLTPELRERILASFDLDALEDLYLPYKQRKKSRALAAREAGLQPLADWIWGCGHGTEVPLEGQTLELWAFTFRNADKGVADARAAIEGARDILVERLAETPELRALARRAYLEDGWLRATKTDKVKPQSKYEAYFAFQERVQSLREPASAHRFLALRRGQAEGELQLSVGGPPDDLEFESRLVAAFEAAALTVPGSPGAEVLKLSARIAFKGHVRTAMENEVFRVLKDGADEAAAHVFAESVRRLLLQPPFGPKPVLGLDPGVRTGCRVAAVDASGSLLAHDVIHRQAEDQGAAARESLVRLVRDCAAQAVAVGNGAAGREAEIFARAALREAGVSVPVLLVNEAGASAYSAGDLARDEFPQLDVTVRGAISVARRLQDPLAELVKVEPRSIGVGQYQHDVAHPVLQRALEAVVESCVNGVGVNLNTASRHLLAHVSGVGPALAGAIVEHREKQGLFRSRRQLLDVEHLGPKAFEQAAGFLRVPGGEHPLDNTAVHPERYAALEALAGRLQKTVADLVGPGVALVREAVDLREEIGAFTWECILAELEKPGRDPRDAFVPFSFREDVRTLEDLRPGMVCPGIVGNVTDFGAFVDVGVHQDGLVHVSQLGDRFVKDPRQAVKPGDHVQVRVLKVDLGKRQISLTMRTPPPERRSTRRAGRSGARRPLRPLTAPPAAPPAEAAERMPMLRPEGVRPLPAGDRPRPPRPERPRPGAAAGRGPAARPLPERRPEPRRQAFNNPFAVLAGLKVPPKRGK